MEDCTDRLIAAGFSPENAAAICTCYCSRNDDEGLDAFVCSCEQYDPLHASKEAV